LSLIAFILIFNTASSVAEANNDLSLLWQQHACAKLENCRETCSFQALSSLDRSQSQLDVTVTKSKELFTVRSLAKLKYSNYQIWIDEIVDIDLETKKIKQIGINERKVGSSEPTYQKWDRHELLWNSANPSANYSKAFRIQTKSSSQDIVKFNTQYPLFKDKYKLDAFGSDWLPDHKSSPSEVRDGDLGLKSFSDNLMTPFYLGFFVSRFVKPNTTTDIDLTIGRERDGRQKNISFVTDANKANLQLSLGGDSEKGKSEFYFDSKTQLINKAKISISAGWLSGEVNFKLLSCVTK
jgi:hypothetical protein